MPKSILMKTLLRKYWIQFVFLIASSLLFIILIPNEEKSYLHTDVKAIRNTTRLIVIAIIFVLLVIIFISTLKHLKTFKAYLNFSLGMISLGLLLFFALFPIFLFTGLALNKFSAKKMVEKKYTVIYTDNNYLELKNLQTYKVDRVEQIVQETEKYIISQNDTLTLSFKKGLFGFEFEPTHRGNFVYPD